MSIVTDAVVQLKSVLETLPQIQRKVVYLYDQEDLMNFTKKLGLPAVGVVYIGMKGNEDSSKTGLAAELVCDIYVIGAETCQGPLCEAKHNHTKLLDDIRSVIRCTPLNSSGAKRKWKFISEQPALFEEGVMAYVQRWSTIVLLTA